MRIRLLDRIVDGQGSFITSYSQLKKIPMAKAIVKHYLNGYVKSEFRRILPEELIVAALLPVQRFQKASDTQVYADTAGRY